MRTTARTACALLLSTACQAPAETPVAPPASPALPGSALAGAVRALETVQALRPAGTWTLVRAITCDSRRDSARALEFERVFLDVTVFAPTYAEAVAGFDAVRSALEAEAQAAARVESTPPERVRAALEGIGTSPAGGAELVSYSDRIRLEVRPGPRAALAPRPGDPVTLGSDNLLNYVQVRASRPEGVGPVSVQLTDSPAEGSLRLALRPAQSEQRYTLAQIAAFLASLENESPALCVTAIAIEPSQHEPDATNPRRWTFEAELTVSAPDAGP